MGFSRDRALAEVVDFRHEQVFEQATTYTCLLFLSREPHRSFEYAVASPPTIIAEGEPGGFSVDAAAISDAPWVFLPGGSRNLIEKVRDCGPALLDLPSRVSRGSSTGADDVFMLRKAGKRHTTRDGTRVDIEEAILRVPIYATDFGRYRFSPAGDERVIFPYVVGADGYRELEEKELLDGFPKAFAYLKSRRGDLVKRKQWPFTGSTKTAVGGSG